MPPTKILRRIDIKNLVRELSENRVDALELVREALSNAKDHSARRVWIKAARDARDTVSVLFVDDGDGMDEARMESFWGVGSSAKSKSNPTIGYKGHGTKLFFDCSMLTVATRAAGAPTWTLAKLAHPAESDALDIVSEPLSDDHPLHEELAALDLLEATGTAIHIEDVGFAGKAHLLDRRRIESYCDWSTVLADVRAGLFEQRHEFHEAVKNGGKACEGLLDTVVPLRPLAVYLRVNGEKKWEPLGVVPHKGEAFLAAWKQDLDMHGADPGLVMYGHRFADAHVSAMGATRVRDDLSSIRLTSPIDWTDADGIAIIARVEGHRRQRETYREATWQNHAGLFTFEERFGLWLCRDFIPVCQRNDLLRQAVDLAGRNKLRYELDSVRNWQVFVNVQSFLPTANRGSISNQRDYDDRIVKALAAAVERALASADFRDWIDRLRTATLNRRRDNEVNWMTERRNAVQKWYQAKVKSDAVEPMGISSLETHEDSDSLLMRAPNSEQEVVYLYALLSGRFKMPLHLLEYDASQGVDAVALLREPSLVALKPAHARVEFKKEVSANNSIKHFFEAIDVLVCWKAGRTGPIYEHDASGIVGKLSKRKKPVLSSAIDTFEIEYESRDGERHLIPVLELSALFQAVDKKK
jgi:Histidine kinase-, DNA gyrase B-, and HSP90-like ATPase